MNTPVIRFGGKTRLVPVLLTVLERLAPHVCYCEPFAGGAALLFAKRPSTAEIIGDVDRAVYDFFRVLRDERLHRELQRELTYTPWSREEMLHCARTWRSTGDLLERVRCWFTVMRQSFTHELEGADWWASKAENQALRFANAVDALEQASQRLRRVQIENRSFEHLLRAYDDERTLFYLDPAYMLEARVDGGYEDEMAAEQHELLLEMVLAAKGQVVLSGYHTPLYDSRLAHLPCIERTRECAIHNSHVHKKSYRTECIWIKAHPYGLFSEFGAELFPGFAAEIAAATEEGWGGVRASEPGEEAETIAVEYENVHLRNFSVTWEDVSRRHDFL